MPYGVWVSGLVTDCMGRAGVCGGRWVRLDKEATGLEPDRRGSALQGFMVDPKPCDLPLRQHTRGLGPALQFLSTMGSALPELGLRPSISNRDGDIEILGAARAVHRFVEAPGDGGTIRWHFVEAGEGEPVVLLHGVPDSWHMWHRQIAELAAGYRVLAIDLKGCGQTEKRPGDYRPAAVAEQLVALFDVLGLDRVNLVTHDLGSVVADYLGAGHPFRVRRYARGQQHLYHFNEELPSQETIFIDPLLGPLLRVPAVVVAAAYSRLSFHPILPSDLRRTVREWSYPGVGAGVSRYFHSSSLRGQWLDRRRGLMDNWRFPVLILQGEHDPIQPAEFYVGIQGTMPDGRVQFVDAGHFFVLENPHQAGRVIREFLGS